jgi:guanylate kinase
MPKPAGRLIVVSGPSGAGKTTVLREVFARSKRPLVLSVSATTRSPRAGEKDGVDYHFLSADDFKKRRERGDFLESFEVFGRGHWYGTLLAEVAPRLDEGKWVVLEIDVQGADAVVRQFPEAATFFVRPGSPEELERRLRARGTESPDAIARRLETARRELVQADRYQHQIINDDIERAVSQMCAILDQLATNH